MTTPIKPMSAEGAIEQATRVVSAVVKTPATFTLDERALKAGMGAQTNPRLCAHTVEVYGLPKCTCSPIL